MHSKFISNRSFEHQCSRTVFFHTRMCRVYSVKIAAKPKGNPFIGRRWVISRCEFARFYHLQRLTMISARRNGVCWKRKTTNCVYCWPGDLLNETWKSAYLQSVKRVNNYLKDNIYILGSTKWLLRPVACVGVWRSLIYTVLLTFCFFALPPLPWEISLSLLYPGIDLAFWFL